MAYGQKHALGRGLAHTIDYRMQLRYCDQAPKIHDTIASKNLNCRHPSKSSQKRRQNHQRVQASQALGRRRHDLDRYQSRSLVAKPTLPREPTSSKQLASGQSRRYRDLPTPAKALRKSAASLPKSTDAERPSI
jgi:hypothetical protein